MLIDQAEVVNVTETLPSSGTCEFLRWEAKHTKTITITVLRTLPSKTCMPAARMFLYKQCKVIQEVRQNYLEKYLPQKLLRMEADITIYT